MFFSHVSFCTGTQTHKGARMVTREQAIREAAEVLVYWLTVDEAQEAA
jgi:hypothetical protein